MKENIIFIFLLSLSINAQNNLDNYSKYFNKELTIWKKSFSNFNLSDFEKENTTKFKKLQKLENDIEDLEKIYKNLGSYSPNKSKFVDLQSYLGLVKKGNYYKAVPEVDQNVDLYLIEENITYRIYNSGSSSGIDEVFWVNEDELLLLGTVYSDDNLDYPFIILVDFVEKRVVFYENNNKKCVSKKKYINSKLKKLKIID